MALKAKLQNLDGVPETLRGEYKEHEGHFYLDIDGIDDHHAIGTLKRAKDYEKDNARKAKEKADAIQLELDKAISDMEELRKTGIPKGDVDKLEQSYKDKYAKDAKALTDKIGALTSSLEKHLLDSQAVKLATELAAKPEYVELLLPHIRNRMKLESGEGDEQVVRILDKDGKPSALNLDDLKKELLGHKAFAAILTGSKATGGGAGGGGGNGGGAQKKLNDMNDAERKEFALNDPSGFQKAVDDARAAAASSY